MGSHDLASALVGKTITSFTLKDDGDSITFHCAEGDVTFGTYGDCCSYTWIESIDTPEALRGRVQHVEEIPMPDRGNVDGLRHKDVDQVAYYGLKIVTEHGHAVLDYAMTAMGITVENSTSNNDCPRCGGLLTQERHSDDRLLGTFWYAYKCLNCGYYGGWSRWPSWRKRQHK